MTARSRVRAALSAGERPADADVRAVCADADTMRDRFAAAALTGMLANYHTTPGSGGSVIRAAYEAADMMIEERKRTAP